MQTKRIIPCLDIYEGRVVKGVNFVNLKDAGDPLEISKYYADVGADELVFLDISASAQGRKITTELIQKIAGQISIPLTVGGGIGDLDDIARVLSVGATKISINSAALKNPTLISDASNKFGSQSVVIAIDAKARPDRSGWDVFLNGGKVNTKRDVVDWAIEAEKKGSGEILLTSMDMDGTQNGYDIPLTYAVSSAVNIPVIASGGAGKLEDFTTVLKNGGADAVLAASLFHFRQVEIPTLKRQLLSEGFDIRI